jgi:LacI family transcriptional regulator, galactose operon repressor
MIVEFFFVQNVTMAIGVLSQLAATGRRVPAGVAVAGCDDAPFAEYLLPALNTVRVPPAETGEQPVDLLLRARRRPRQSRRAPGRQPTSWQKWRMHDPDRR